MAASTAFLCYCERKYRGVKVGGKEEKGERERVRRKMDANGRRGGKRENGTKRTKEKKGRGRDAGKRKTDQGRRQLSHLGVLTASKPQRSGSRKPTAAANPSPRLVRGKMGRKGWLSTLLGLSPGQGGFLC